MTQNNFQKLYKDKEDITYMTKRFHVLIQKDEDEGYIGKVPALPGCLSQGDTLDELIANMKEAISLYLETNTSENDFEERFVGIQEVFV